MSPSGQGGGCQRDSAIVTATVANTDIPDGATYLALLVQPQAHATDGFARYEVRAHVAQKVIQGIPS